MSDPKVEHQIELEKLYSKNQLIPRIKKEFTDCKTFNFSKYFKMKEIPEKFGYDLLAQMALYRRANIATLVGLLKHHCDSCQEVVDLLYKAAVADLIDWSTDLQIFIVKFTISDDVQAELDKFQFPLPMVVEPKELKSNTDSGYLTSKSSVILKNGNHHNQDVCLDHLNRMNKIKFSINMNTATMIKNKWRNLDKAKEGETKEDFQKRKKAFEKYDKSTKDVMKLLLKEGNEFYLTHKYDKRGRVYCQGYHVSYQAAPWNKAVIELADKEIIL